MRKTFAALTTASALAAVIALGPALSQTTPELRVTADRGSFKIGEPVRLSLEVVAPAATQVEIQAPDADLGPFELLDRAPVQRDSLPGGLVRTTAQLTVTAYTMGSATLPPLTAVLIGKDGERRVVRADSLTLGIENVIPEAAADTADLRPLKRPFGLPGGFPWWIVWLGLALAAAVTAFIIIRHRRRALAPAIEALVRDTRPADVIALEALDVLRRDRLPASGKMKEHYIRLTDIFRLYLERRYHIPALDLTTSEILADMTPRRDGEHSGQVASDEYDELARLLEEADLVKFARVIPLAPLAEGAVDRAADFVRKTAAPRLPPGVTSATQDSSQPEATVAGERQ